MIKSLTVINYLGNYLTINLANPFDVGMAITEITGLGPVNANIVTTDYAISDGAVYNSSRLSYRNIVIKMKLLGTDSDPKIETTRNTVYKYFPIKKPLWLIFTTDKKEVMIQGYVESDEPEIFSDWETTSISIICPDPYFQSLESTITGFTDVSPSFEFPFPQSGDDFEFADIQFIDEKNLYYVGEVETGLDIELRFKGGINSSYIKIRNTTTMDEFIINTDKLETKYGSLDSGDVINISTYTGNKRITLTKDNVTRNIANCIDKDSSWIKLLPGDNVMTYLVEDGVSGGLYNIETTLTNKVLYEGI